MPRLPKSRDDLKSALPDTSKTLQLNGLDASIEIYRDGYGIPHVKAQTVPRRLLWAGLRHRAGPPMAHGL